MAAKFDQLTLEDKFNNLTGSQESVQSLSRYILTNAIHVKSVVSTLMRELKQAKKERHIVFLYVINDVLQHSKRKNAQRIYDEILAVLTDVVTYFRNHSDNSQIERTKRIIKIWEDRDVVTKSCITNLYSILDSDQSSKVSVPVEEFKLSTLTESWTKYQNFCQIVDMKEKGASAFDRYTSENIKAVKDRTEGTKYIAKFDEARSRWSDYLGALEDKSKACADMIKNINDCNIYHASELDKVKIIANAYKSLFDRIKKTKMKLDDKVLNMVDEPVVTKKPVENDDTQVQDMDLDNSDDERGPHDNTTSLSHSAITINAGIPIPPVGRRELSTMTPHIKPPPDTINQAVDQGNLATSTYPPARPTSNSWPLQRSTIQLPNEPIRFPPTNEPTPVAAATGMRYDSSSQGQAETVPVNFNNRLYDKPAPSYSGQLTDRNSMDHGNKFTDANNISNNNNSNSNQNNTKPDNTIQQLAQLLSLSNPTASDNKTLASNDYATSQKTTSQTDSSITSLFYNLLPSLRGITAQNNDTSKINEQLEDNQVNDDNPSVTSQSKQISSDVVEESNLSSQIPVRNTTSFATGQRRMSNVGKGRGLKGTLDNRTFQSKSPNKGRGNQLPSSSLSTKPYQTDRGPNRLNDVQPIQTLHDVRPPMQSQPPQLFYQSDIGQGAQHNPNTHIRPANLNLRHETAPMQYEGIPSPNETLSSFYSTHPTPPPPLTTSNNMQAQLVNTTPIANSWRGNRKRPHGDSVDRRSSLSHDEFSDSPVRFGDDAGLTHRKRAKSESECSSSGSPQSIPVLQQHKRSPYAHSYGQGPRRSNIQHPRRSMEDQGKQISVLDPRHPPLYQNRSNVYHGYHK